MKAYLDAFDRITVIAEKYYYNGDTGGFYVRINEHAVPCSLVGRTERPDGVEYALAIDSPFSLEDRLMVADRYGAKCPVQPRFIVKTDWFEEYCTTDTQLGALYEPEGTEFRLWAPTSRSALVELHQGDTVSYHAMTRQKGGVFAVRIEGDLKHALYMYIIVRDTESVRCCDPYALSSTADHEYSAVIDPGEIMGIEDVPLSPCSDPVIYEMNIRDLTVLSSWPGEYHGKYLSLCEEGQELDGMPCGADYLAMLGVSHVQVQPVGDFEGIDERYPEMTYNWGYNPLSFLVPEGSYSTDPQDPYARVTEFRKMVTALHRKGIRLTVDAVLNHVYDLQRSDLNMTVPYYYFRWNGDGTPSNGTFCGNDLDSERVMVRQLYLRTVDVLFGLYGVNGLRLDLMGILDTDTVNRIRDRALTYDRSALIYGEGWDMPTLLGQDRKASIANQVKMPGVGHFNDRFRDVIKGGTGDDRLSEKGWLSGGEYSNEEVIAVLEGSRHIFDDAGKSVNYLESHDNSTLWDKLCACSDEPKEVLRKRQVLMIKVMLLSRGIPFLHAGMEYYASKGGRTNSYCAGDAVNGFDWRRCRTEYETVKQVQEAIALRKRLNTDSLKVWTSEGLYLFDYGTVRVVLNPGEHSRKWGKSVIPAFGTVVLEEE